MSLETKTICVYRDRNKEHVLIYDGTLPWDSGKTISLKKHWNVTMPVRDGDYIINSVSKSTAYFISVKDRKLEKTIEYFVYDLRFVT